MIDKNDMMGKNDTIDKNDICHKNGILDDNDIIAVNDIVDKNDILDDDETIDENDILDKIVLCSLWNVVEFMSTPNDFFEAKGMLSKVDLTDIGQKQVPTFRG